MMIDRLIDYGLTIIRYDDRGGGYWLDEVEL